MKKKSKHSGYKLKPFSSGASGFRLAPVAALSLLATFELIAQGAADQPAASAPSPVASPAQQTPTADGLQTISSSSLTKPKANLGYAFFTRRLSPLPSESAKPEGSAPAGNTPAANAPTANASPAVTSAPPPLQPVATDGSIPMSPPLLKAPKATKHEVSVSGDMMVGSGTITLPLGYSLKESLGSSFGDLQPGAFSVPRDSTFYGGTISYSYGQAWYLDLSYSQGQTSGSQAIDVGWLGELDSKFNIDETWYQAYIKYTFPQLRGKRLSAYLRGGASYGMAELEVNSTISPTTRYIQNDETTDILLNLGGGVGYNMYSSRRFRFGLQGELEAFFGQRAQTTLETLSADEGLEFKPKGIDNTLYGLIGRATMRAEYRLGKSGLFKMYCDLGVETRYTMIDYPGGGTAASDETLFGPYAKLGLRYAF
jgi:hypothetical protein